MLSWGCLAHECESDDNPYGGQAWRKLEHFELLEKLVDVGKWVLVLYGLLVQWTVVDTKSVRSILLLDENNTTTPWRRTWSDETHTLLNIELFLQLLQLFRSKLVRKFTNRFHARLKIDDEFNWLVRRHS